jgi:hypothetical protein
MSSSLYFFPYLVLWAVLMRALLVRAKIVPPLCARCGQRVESSSSGRRVCTCVGDSAPR